ncbi:MAG: prepilin-type N-terminal cleavage/methylation domain-containing protein [Planctomycetes bacterium]|nr:prepilin-type N-terminal cleavage/methylation domain-containing protein [Planctomycetota bacterium]
MRIAAARARGGRFTLIEMLVVVAIIAILAAMLSPSLQKALRSARGVACANSLKQIGTAFNMYAGDYNGLYPLIKDPPGVVDSDVSSGNWNHEALQRFKSWPRPLFSYCGDMQLFLCPSDRQDMEDFQLAKDKSNPFDSSDQLRRVSYIYRWCLFWFAHSQHYSPKSSGVLRVSHFAFPSRQIVMYDRFCGHDGSDVRLTSATSVNPDRSAAIVATNGLAADGRVTKLLVDRRDAEDYDANYFRLNRSGAASVEADPRQGYDHVR